MGWLRPCLVITALTGALLAWLAASLPDLVKHLEKVHTSCHDNPVEEAASVLAAKGVPFKCGVVEVPSASAAVRVEAYLQPSGGFCWSNAGVIAIGGRTLIVDSVQSVVLQSNFNKEARLLNGNDCSECLFVLSHPDVDHFYGINAMPANRSIMHSEAATKVDAQLAAVPSMKTQVSLSVFGGRILTAFSSLVAIQGGKLPPRIEALEYKALIAQQAARFGIDGLVTEWPSRITRQLIGKREHEVTPGVEMVCPGGIHSNMDCWMRCAEAKVVFAGDLLFIGVTPLMWRGDMQAWVDALDEMLERTTVDAEDWHFVPGHGPVVARSGVQLVREYWAWVKAKMATTCPGMSEAAAWNCTKSLLAELPDPYPQWHEKERLLASVYVELYIQSRGGQKPQFVIKDKMKLFADIAMLHKALT